MGHQETTVGHWKRIWRHVLKGQNWGSTPAPLRRSPRRRPWRRSDVVKEFLCSVLQGVFLAALRRQSRCNSGAFWRRCSRALEARCRRHCRRGWGAFQAHHSSAFRSGSGSAFSAIEAQFRRPTLVPLGAIRVRSQAPLGRFSRRRWGAICSDDRDFSGAPLRHCLRCR